MSNRVGRAAKFLLRPLPLLLTEALVLVAIDVALHSLWLPNSGDDLYYRALAQSLAHGHGFSSGGVPTAYVMPGYPVFLALLALVSGGHYLVIAIGAQAVLLAVTAYMCGDLAVLVGFDGRARLFTQLAVAFYPPFVRYAAMTLTETLATFLVVSSVWLWALAFRAWDQEDGRRFAGLLIVASGAVSAGVAVRPTAVLLPVALGMSILIMRIKRPLPSARCFTWLLLGSVAACVVLVGGWGMRNFVVMEEFIPFSSEGYIVAYLGNLVAANGMGGYADLEKAVGVERAAEIFDMGEVERMRVFRSLYLDEVKSRPLEMVGLWPQKAMRFWLNRGYGGTVSARSVLGPAFNAMLLVGSVVGGIVAVRRRGHAGVLVLAILFFMALLFVAHVLTFAAVRYAFPALALAFVLSGGAVEMLLQWLATHRRQTSSN